jgi:hypothetical protein
MALLRWAGDLEHGIGGVDGTLGVAGYYRANGLTTYRHRVRTTHSSIAASNAIVFDLCDGTTTGFTEYLRITPSGITVTGTARLTAMPTSSAGLASGTLWNDSGTVKVA